MNRIGRRRAWLGVLGVTTGIVVACGGSSGNTGVGNNDDAGEDGSVPNGDASALDDGAIPDGGTSISDSATDSPVILDDGATVSDAGLLAAGATCSTGNQCASGGCDYTGKCASAPSCVAHNGGDTCGSTGTDDCCTTIAVPNPTTPYKLDKYNITAGRMRAFITATGGNVRGYVQAHRPAYFETVWDPWLPIEMDDGTFVTGQSHAFTPGTGQDGVNQQLGPIHYGTEGPGNEGCLTSEVGNARTYRLPDAINTTDFNDVQQYTQDVLDQKPQQCTTFFMFAAFCIWDGGRLASLDELDYAWDPGDAGTRTYPWGASPAPAGWDNAYPFDPAGMGFGTQAPPPPADQTYANYKYNFFMPANIQCLDGDAGACDYSIYLAPPGRFPKGDGIFGHSDFVGNVYNVSLPMFGTVGTDPSTRTVGLNRTGAFDNHAIPNVHPAQQQAARNWPSTNKYLAVGARCARD